MSDFDRVKQSINLADYIGRYAPLKRAGTVMQCCCPLPGHNDKTPSFQVKDDHWICRGKCGAHGDIFDFVQLMHGWDKQEALQELARFAGITLEPLSPEAKQKQDKTARLYALMDDACRIYQTGLWADIGARALGYLQAKRGLTEESLRLTKIGYAPDRYNSLSIMLKDLGYTDDEIITAGMCKRNDKGDLYDTFRNRIMIPIRDHKGHVVAFSGRDMGDKGPKYLHNATNDIFRKSEIVHRMPSNPTKMGADAFKTIIAVEGTIDPVSALNRGFYNVVSLLGKSLSEAQIGTLQKMGMERFVFCLDRDEAGRSAVRTLTEKHVSALASKGIELYAMFAPHGKDPDDTFREMPHLWQPAVDAARPVVEVLIDMDLSALGENATAAQKSKMAGDLLPVLKSDDPFVEDENFKILSSRTGIAVEALKNWAKPRMELLSKPAPVFAPAVSTVSGLPTTEEWVLHGIIVNEHEDWLTRANNRLFVASVDTMPYALAPLSLQDFTEPSSRRLMELILKGQDVASLYVEGNLIADLKPAYERIARLDAIGKDYNLSFDFNVFVGRVYSLRLKRLRQERPTFEAKEPAKARECAIAIACLMMATEELEEA